MSVELFAGYSEAVITPHVGALMTGYGYYLNRRVESVLDPLKVRAIALEALGERLILISCDLLGLTVADTDKLRSSIANKHGFGPQQVLIACTHTHSGPASQPLPGIAEVDELYMASVFAAIASIADHALRDLKPAALSYAIEPVEAIALNRKSPDGLPIDPLLKLIVLTRPHDIVHIISYAAHPVAAGVTAAVSADWPGRLIASFESTGHKAVFFQGFSGDINPAERAQSNADVDSTVGRLGAGVYRAAESVAGRAKSSAGTTLRASEVRIDLPFVVPSPGDIEARRVEVEMQRPSFAGQARFADEWAAATLARLPQFRQQPFLKNVPVQALAIGDIMILALAGESFCAYDHHFRERYPTLLTLGYANGNVGYFPTQAAFANPGDYEAHGAPMFYQGLAFSPRVEALLLDASEQVLNAFAE